MIFSRAFWFYPHFHRPLLQRLAVPAHVGPMVPRNMRLGRDCGDVGECRLPRNKMLREAVTNSKAPSEIAKVKEGHTQR